MAETVKAMKIVVKLEDRQDGGLMLTSRDVPGLFLSGRDKAHVWSLLAPTVTGLLRANRGLNVRKVWGADTYPDGENPRDYNLQVEHDVEVELMLELVA